MRRLLLVLSLLLVPAPLLAQESIADHIAHERAILDAAEAALVKPTKPKEPGYTALSDLTVKPKPAPLKLGPAGFAFTDPTFGSPMIRVTDETTSGGSSLRVPSSAHATAWNADGTKLYVVNAGGGAIFFSFDGASTTKLAASVASQLEPQFSFVDPNLVWGVSVHTVKTWRLDTGAVANVFDFDATYPRLPLKDTYVGGILLADDDVWAAHFGGGGIDQHVFVHHSKAGLLDVRPLRWKIHAIAIDRTGRFVNVYPANDPNTGRLPGCPGPTCIAQVYLWDTQAGTTLTPLTVRPAGHDSLGYGNWINQDCCTKTTWDASQWQLRDLATPNTTTDLIPAPITPQHVYVSDHTNWRAAKPGVKVPVISANYRFKDGLNQADYPWRPWDEEIIAIATDGTGKVWRFAHHQSIACTPDCDFWAEPVVNCSPNGKACTFTSNWGQANGRQDVFLVRLQ